MAIDLASGNLLSCIEKNNYTSQINSYFNFKFQECGLYG